jgi:hypothetical protein
MSKRTAFFITGVSLIAFVGLVAAQGSESGSRQRWIGESQNTSKVVFPGDPAHPTRCGPAPAALIQGAGLTNLQGQHLAEQSHCLGADGSFSQGRFRFTSVDGNVLFGRYFGTLAPTITSIIPPNPAVPPGGVWLIIGNVCVEGGDLFRGIVNDCAENQYSPARGILNVTTGAGTVYVDGSLGVTEEEQ